MRKLSELKRARIEREVSEANTDALESVLSARTVAKIEKGEPVSYRSAALYCKALGFDPYQIIIIERKIPIIEEIA